MGFGGGGFQGGKEDLEAEVGGRRMLPSVWALREESRPCLREAAGKPCSQPGVGKAGDRGQRSGCRRDAVLGSAGVGGGRAGDHAGGNGGTVGLALGSMGSWRGGLVQVGGRALLPGGPASGHPSLFLFPYRP